MMDSQRDQSMDSVFDVFPKMWYVYVDDDDDDVDDVDDVDDDDQCFKECDWYWLVNGFFIWLCYSLQIGTH